MICTEGLLDVYTLFLKYTKRKHDWNKAVMGRPQL